MSFDGFFVSDLDPLGPEVFLSVRVLVQPWPCRNLPVRALRRVLWDPVLGWTVGPAGMGAEDGKAP